VADVKSTLTMELPTVSGLGSRPSVGTLIQAPGSHDIFRLKVTPVDGLEALFHGAPAVVRWSSRYGNGAFHGFVHRVDPVYQPGNKHANITLVGASYPLMQPGSLSWIGVRASDVVRDIAFRFGLSCDVEDHPLVYPQVAQSGRSYWQLMNELAEETGYVLRMEGATLMFRSRDSLLSHFRPMAPEVPVQSFSPKVGAFNPELGATSSVRSVSGVDPYRGAIVADRGAPDLMREGRDPMFDHLLTGDVVHTQMDASTAVAAALEANRFTTVASVTAPGNPLVAPERVVWPTPVPTDLAGHWVVRAVEHHIERGKYTTRAELATDGLGGSLLKSGEPPRAAASPGHAVVDPHRPGALPSWPYPEPVLRTNSPVKGAPGRVLTDFSWIAPSTESRIS